MKHLLVFAMLLALMTAPLQAQPEPPFYDTPTHTLITDERVHDLAYHPDGTTLAVAEMSEVSIWSSESGEQLHSLTPAGTPLRISYTPDGERLLVLTEVEAERQFEVWTLETLSMITIPYSGFLQDFALSPDGDTLAFILGQPTSGNQRIYLTSLANNIDGDFGYRELAGDPAGSWNTLAFDSTGERLAAGVWFSLTNPRNNDGDQETGRAFIWTLESESPASEYTVEGTLPITQVLFSPDGTSLFAGSFDLITWDVDSAEVQHAERYAHEIGLATGGDYLVVARMAFDNMNGVEHMRTPLTLRNWQTGEVIAYFRRAYEVEPGGGGGGAYNLDRIPVAMRADGTQFASVDPDGTVSLWMTDGQ